jgi:hypothetical protein
VYGLTCNTSGTAVRGDHPSGNFGLLGNINYGVYGYLYPAALGQYGIMGYNSDGVNGDSYAFLHTIGGTEGYCYWGNPYTFGVAGYSFLLYDRSGGCFGGYENGSPWGCMAYRNSGSTVYGGYFTSYTSGGGKAGEAAINNGIGAWGDLFGATITGGIYGTFTRGDHYALYAHGNSYSDGLIVSLQKNQENTNTVLYTPMATSVTIQTYGYGQLLSGKCSIEFDKTFRDVVSQVIPVIVTITPIGECNGIHLTDIAASGFSVEENNSGRSDVKFTFIAIGQRAGYEKPSLPEEVVQSDYIDKVEKSMVDDGSTKGDSPGLYYENGQLITGTHPSLLPDPNKPKTNPNALPKNVPPGIDKNGIGNGKAPETGHATVNYPSTVKANANIPDISKLR